MKKLAGFLVIGGAFVAFAGLAWSRLEPDSFISGNFILQIALICLGGAALVVGIVTAFATWLME